MTKLPIRIGQGYDVHRFAVGREFRLGGVLVPFEKGLLGHSDADVLLHAISDALLGALALRDIGFHFPDTDPGYEGADSKVLLGKVLEMVAASGYKVGNIDATVIAERPKINPHIPEMVTVIAGILKINEDQISIKATTNEKMGFAGREEGIAATAVALLLLGETQKK